MEYARNSVARVLIFSISPKSENKKRPADPLPEASMIFRCQKYTQYAIMNKVIKGQKATDHWSEVLPILGLTANIISLSNLCA